MKAKSIGIILVILAVLLAVSGCIETIRDAEHTGIITAVEPEGVVWKSTNVYVKTDAESTQEDLYCLEDSSLVPELKQLAKSKARVTVLYRNEMIVAPWRCDGSATAGIITGIKRD